jgi:hypothetical protein
MRSLGAVAWPPQGGRAALPLVQQEQLEGGGLRRLLLLLLLLPLAHSPAAPVEERALRQVRVLPVSAARPLPPVQVQAQLQLLVVQLLLAAPAASS